MKNKVMKIHRKFPERKWEWRALSARVLGRDIIYGVLRNKGKTIERVEVYSGKNYIVGSKRASYSRAYTMSKVPKSLKPVVDELKKQHSKTKWSKRRRVNLN